MNPEDEATMQRLFPRFSYDYVCSHCGAQATIEKKEGAVTTYAPCSGCGKRGIVRKPADPRRPQ